jgi:hypothetical protein
LKALKTEELSEWKALEKSVRIHIPSSSFRAPRADFYARLQAGIVKANKEEQTNSRKVNMNGPDDFRTSLITDTLNFK